MNHHAFTVNRGPDVPMADGSVALGTIVVVADPALMPWDKVLDIFRLLADGSPRRSLALFYTPAAPAPVPAPDSGAAAPAAPAEMGEVAL